MLITNKRTGRQVEVTEAEAKKIAGNPHISGLYNIPKIEEKKKLGKPLTEKPVKVEAPTPVEAPAPEVKPDEPTAS